VYHAPNRSLRPSTLSFANNVAAVGAQSSSAAR